MQCMDITLKSSKESVPVTTRVGDPFQEQEGLARKVEIDRTGGVIVDDGGEEASHAAVEVTRRRTRGRIVVSIARILGRNWHRGTVEGSIL